MGHKLLANGKHRWDFRLGKKRIRYTDTDFKRGEKHVRGLLVEYDQGTSGVYSSKTLYDILDGYFAQKSLDKPSHKLYTLTNHIKWFKTLLPNSRLSYFNQKDKAEYNLISDWLEKHRDKKQTGNRRLATLRAVFNWAIKRGYMSDNPCKRVSKFFIKQPYPRFLDHQEISRLFICAPREQFSKYCFMILHTGMRPEEALSLKWADVDLGNGVIYILDQKNGDRSALKADYPLLEWLKKESRVNEWVLGGYTYAMLTKDSRRAIQEAGINLVKKPGCGKFTIYGLRHTYASHLLMAGIKIEAVAKRLRHKDINLTYKHYGHLTDQYMEDSVNQVDLTGQFSDTSKKQD